MKPINILAATAALVLSADPAFAVEWVYILTDGDGSVWYYDADTIQRSGKRVTGWERRDHSRDKTVKQRETRTRQTYDCADRTITLLYKVSYQPDGTSEPFTWETRQQKKEYIVPGTIGEAVLKAVCAATAP